MKNIFRWNSWKIICGYNHFEFDLSESIPHLLRLFSARQIIGFGAKKKFEASQKGEKKKNNEIDLSTECDHAEYRKKKVK